LIALAFVGVGILVHMALSRRAGERRA
jgi:hypothetical protein